MNEAASSAGYWIVGGAFVLVFAIIALGAWFSRTPPLSSTQIRTLMQEAVDGPLPATGLRVPLASAMGSLSRLSGIVFGRNTINPLLELHPDHIALRVLRRREIAWRELRSVDLQQTIARPSVILHLSDGSCFIARPWTDAWRIRLLRRLQARGVALGPAAARHLDALGAMSAAPPESEPVTAGRDEHDTA